MAESPSSIPQGAPESRIAASVSPAASWPLWEVFLRSQHGIAHKHVGSLHAADSAMAMTHARDLYTRRGEGVSLWVIESSDIVASSPGEKEPFFDPASAKIYRHPTFFEIPAEVKHL
jgi:ring-1,2-phenylacetyl-CoA epoxidase subunit PaaB